MSDGDEDPFEDLREDVDAREGDPFEHLETEDGDTDGDGGDGQFGDERELTPSLDDVDAREGDPFESLGAFEDRSVDEVDPDVVWQTLASAEAEGSVTKDRERTFAEVSKHSYCEQCEHFSPPPEVACGHEGTEIVEFLDMETVRLVDCPVVAERRRLQRRD